MMTKPEITARLGDIVKQADCDAIVNSANGNLRAGSGVCGAIYAGAGPSLEPYSMTKAPLGLAQAIETPAFNLPNRWIIHCRGPRFHSDPDPAHHLALCLTNTLLLAERLGVNRIAVPAISMGIFAYPPEEAAMILVQSARAMLDRLPSVQEIRFAVTKRELLNLFEREIDSNQR